MANIHTLLNQLTTQEKELLTQQFLAPCVQNGRVRTRLSGLVYTFRPQPHSFQGWGIFQPLDTAKAKVMTTATLPQINVYLNQLLPFRLLLTRVLQGKTWLAFPVNEGDVTQRLGWMKPVPVHLVTEGSMFDTAIARWDGRLGGLKPSIAVPSLNQLRC